MTDTTETWPTLAEVKRRHVVATLEKCGGNKTAAAAMLKVAVKTVYNMISEWEEEANTLKGKRNGNGDSDIGGEG